MSSTSSTLLERFDALFEKVILKKVVGVARKAAKKRKEQLDREYKKYLIDPVKPPKQNKLSRDEVRRIMFNYKKK